jgi:hypothetical protein
VAIKVVLVVIVLLVVVVVLLVVFKGMVVEILTGKMSVNMEIKATKGLHLWCLEMLRAWFATIVVNLGIFKGNVTKGKMT